MLFLAVVKDFNGTLSFDLQVDNKWQSTINLYKQLFSFDETVDAMDVGAAALASDIGWILVMMTSSSSVRLYGWCGVALLAHP